VEEEEICDYFGYNALKRGRQQDRTAHMHGRRCSLQYLGSYLSSSGNKAKNDSSSEQAIEALGERTPNQSAKLQGHGLQKRCSLAKFHGKWHPEYVTNTKKKEIKLMKVSSAYLSDGHRAHVEEIFTVKS
jgi:hypothetical protein